MILGNRFLHSCSKLFRDRGSACCFGIRGMGDISADDDDIALFLIDDLIDGAVALAERVFACLSFTPGVKWIMPGLSAQFSQADEAHDVIGMGFGHFDGFSGIGPFCEGSG